MYYKTKDISVLDNTQIELFYDGKSMDTENTDSYTATLDVIISMRRLAIMLGVDPSKILATLTINREVTFKTNLDEVDYVINNWLPTR